jgi:glutamate/tyrosine decarboxylase-like PLP-dependent enzyme
MLGIKNKLINYSKKIIRQSVQLECKEFPDQSTSNLKIKINIFLLARKLAKFKNKFDIAHLHTYPSSIVIFAWEKLLPFNPGNLGNWSTLQTNQTYPTGYYEQLVIREMIDLYHGNTSDWEGYFTTGGTEGNLYSVWTGRKYLQNLKIDKSQICILKTSLTHYSIDKAADITNLKIITVGLNDFWSMDVEDLTKQIKKLSKSFKGFLIPLTIGYTLTGTQDNILEIVTAIKNLKKNFPHLYFYLWIDAALSGLIEPFINNEFRPLEHPEIQTIIIDFHKFSGLPIPSGLILYRKNLRCLIEQPIDYLEQTDSTISGSRTGISPIAAWAYIHSYGKKGIKAIVEANLDTKQQFINNHLHLKGVQIVNHSTSLNIGIILKDKTHQQYFIDKFDLLFKIVTIKFSSTTKKMLISKAIFLNNT